jgi:hypothetical protein
MCSPARPRSKLLLLAGDRPPWVFASTLEILDSGATVDAGISTIGVAGPTPLIKLLQYAVRCGVGSSPRTAAHTLSAVGNVSQLVTAPEQHLMTLARALDAGTSYQLVAPHFFVSGGTLKTAQWLRRLVDGISTLAATTTACCYQADWIEGAPRVRQAYIVCVALSPEMAPAR